MNDEHITTRLLQFIQQQFPLARKQRVEGDTPLLDGGIVDSMGTLDLVVFIESEFDIVLSDEEMLADNFDTLQGMTEFVRSKLASRLSVAS